MKRRLLVALVGLCSAFSSVASYTNTISVTGAVWCPNNCYPNKEKPGIMLELAQRALEVQGYEIRYTERPWSRAVLDVKIGLFDALIGPSKSDAPSFIYPSEPVALAENCFFTPRKLSWQYSGIKSLADVILGIGRDETVSEEIDSYVSKAADSKKVLVLSGGDYMERLIGMLVEERVTAVIADVNVFNFMLKNTGHTNRVRNAGCMGTPLKIYLAFSPSKYTLDSPVVRQFDEGLRYLKTSGEFDRILRRYNAKPW